MDESFLIPDVFIHILIESKYLYDQQNLSICCKYLNRLYKNLIKDRLECINIDLELINDLLEMNNINDIYLSESLLTEIFFKLKKYYFNIYNYNNVHNQNNIIITLFQQCINLFIANNKIELKNSIMIHISNYITKYSLSYLYTATRYSNFGIFENFLSEFANYCWMKLPTDNIYIQYKEFPGYILNKVINHEKIDNKLLTKYITSNKLYLSKGESNLIDCDLLIKLAEENKNKIIYENLIQFKNYKLMSIFWSAGPNEIVYDDDYDMVNHEEIDKFVDIPGNYGFIVALPKIIEYELINNKDVYTHILDGILSSKVIKIGNTKIFKL